MWNTVYLKRTCRLGLAVPEPEAVSSPPQVTWKGCHGHLVVHRGRASPGTALAAGIRLPFCRFIFWTPHRLAFQVISLPASTPHFACAFWSACCQVSRWQSSAFIYCRVACSTCKGFQSPQFPGHRYRGWGTRGTHGRQTHTCPRAAILAVLLSFLQRAAPGHHWPLFSRQVLVAYSLSCKAYSLSCKITEEIETLHKLNVQYVLGRQDLAPKFSLTGSFNS